MPLCWVLCFFPQNYKLKTTYAKPMIGGSLRSSNHIRVSKPHGVRRIGLYDGLLLGQDLLGNCVNMNGAPRMRTPSRRSGARSCHAPGRMAARGPPVGVLRSAAHRRAESRFWGVFIFAVHRAFVLGLGARHRGIVDLSEGVIRCVTVFACYSSSSSRVVRCV